MSLATKNLGELLVFTGIVDEEQLNAALTLQKRDCKGMLLGDILSNHCGASRDAVEATFLENVLLPMANNLLFREAMRIVRDTMGGEHAVHWVLLRPQQCSRHCVDSQRMHWDEGALTMGERTMTDTLEVEGRLTMRCSGIPELEVPMRFYYDIRKKRIKAKEKALEEMRKAISTSTVHCL